MKFFKLLRACLPCHTLFADAACGAHQAAERSNVPSRPGRVELTAQFRIHLPLDLASLIVWPESKPWFNALLSLGMSLVAIDAAINGMDRCLAVSV